jgi:L-rhamnose mutarotase
MAPKGLAGMEQIAFLMRLKPGNAREYRRRHDEIWPELKSALTRAGIRDYSIFLDEDGLTLFAVLRLTPDNTRRELRSLPVMRRWWDFMADLMEVDQTNRPIERPLTPVFHMD